MNITDIQKLVVQTNEDNGWNTPRPFDADVSLLHTEVSEAYEAYRDTGHTNEWEGEGGKPEGVPSELADVFIRLLDTCHRYNVDLEDATLRKLVFNKTRGYRHANGNGGKPKHV